MQETLLKKRATVEYLRDLAEACQWLDIDRGRAWELARHLKRFHEGESLNDEQLLAYFESYDIVEIYRLWHQDVEQFPGLIDKIRNVAKKGPTLSDGENPDESTNRPRNDSFSILLAGGFHSAGIPVRQVEGISREGFENNATGDFSFAWHDSLINVECKRPRSRDQLVKNAKKAKKQIVKSRRSGIVALDCSVLIRPNGTVFSNTSDISAEDQFSTWLAQEIYPRVKGVFFSSGVLGLILYCRVPVLTPTPKHRNRAQLLRSDCIMPLICFDNPRYPVSINLMYGIASSLRTSSLERAATTAANVGN